MNRLELLKNDGWWIGLIECTFWNYRNGRRSRLQKRLIKEILKYKNELVELYEKL